MTDRYLPMTEDLETSDDPDALARRRTSIQE